MANQEDGEITLALQCLDHVLLVSSSNPTILSYIHSLERIHVFFPERVNPEITPVNSPRLRLKDGEPEFIDFDLPSRTITLQTNWSHINETKLIEILLLRLLGLACFDSGSILVHAAGIATIEGSYLLIGGSGAGKTSMVIPLCARYYHKFVANDYLRLTPGQSDPVLVTARDEFIDFRRAGSDEMLRLLPKNLVSQIQNRFPNATTPWVKSTPPFRAHDLGLPLAPLPCPVRGAFFLKISEREYEHMEPLSKREAASRFLAEIPWPIKDVGSPVVNNFGEILAPPISSELGTGWHSVRNTVNKLVGHSPAWAVHAPLELALEFVHTMITTS